MMRILSLGAGVQSSTILLMSIAGELPPIDHCIFADVGWEPAEVYAWLEYLQGIAWKADIPVHVVSAGNLRTHVMDAAATGKRSSSPPFFTMGEDGRAAIINRSCTSNFKIAPIERKVKELMGHVPKSRLPKQVAVEQWIGISGDEMQRMKVSQAPWMRFWHPLIELPWVEGQVYAPSREHPMTREDCLRWLEAHGYPPAPRSACIGCPFHNNAEWRRIRADPVQWKDAVEFDRSLRTGRGFGTGGGLIHGMKREVYLHRSLLPLEQAPIDDDEPGQGLIGFVQECQGMCGL